MRSRLRGAVTILLVGLVAGAAASPAAAQSMDPAAPSKPASTNILLLMAEDMSPRVGAFGDRVARTPNLDRLAAQGVRYPNVFTTAGVCAPSRAGLMLGMHQISTGTQHMRTGSRSEGGYLAVPPRYAKAFPELLRSAGYFTYQHGKTDYQFSGTGSGSGPSSIWDAEDNEGQWADREAGQPFFGMINYFVTHESGLFEPLGSWPRGIYPFLLQIMHAWERRGWTDDVVPTDPSAVRVPPYYPDIPEVRDDLARLYDNIQIMDAMVGELLDRLERDGLADSTIVIWTTDHGDGLPRAKRDLFDAGIQVPMIIRWPDRLRPAHLSPDEVDARLISFVDLSATILGLAALTPPTHFHGHDFLATPEPIREFVFASRDRIDDVPDRQRAVRSERFKYIRSFRPELPGGHRLEFRDNLRSMRALYRELTAGRLDEDQLRWFRPPGVERLFDLERDPFELRDVSQDPAYAAPLEEMRRAYADWRARVPDLSDEPEERMIERFEPNGKQEVTADPTLSLAPDRSGADRVRRVALTSASPGASIEYRLDGERWRLYSDPLQLAPGQALEARAVRYGWRESGSVHLQVPAH